MKPENSPHLDQPLVILVRGLPGSGKSHLVDALVAALGEVRVTRLDPDAIDFAAQDYQDLVQKLQSEGVEEKYFPHRYLLLQACAALDEGKIVIWSQAFTLLGGLQRTIARLAEHTQALRVLVVEVHVDPAVAKERVRARAQAGGHDVSDERFEKFVDEYRSFADEGFETVQVDGADDVQVNCAKVLEVLAR